ncbi:MAG: DUF5665 domain-containing protein [bacterium]|nr:DUF5665 domain-containing protein [bacterium]
MDSKDEPVERIYKPRGKMILDNFLGGVAWGLGSLIGVTVVIAILGYFVSQINLVPILGSWISQIIQAAGLEKTLIVK